ncbi:hypothetical protein DIPPA_08001 [Diplonema papillatum]|nr:hypothetical protein DIPPA_08001 [Diplonema papillatum]
MLRTSRFGLKRLYCSTAPSISVKVGEGTLTYTGPSDVFKKMSEEEFYKLDELHHMFTQLGLEVFIPEEDAATPAATQVPEQPPTEAKPSSPKPNDSDELPPLHPLLRDVPQLEITQNIAVWMLKKQIEEVSGVGDEEFDVYYGKSKMEDHKYIAQYMQTMTDENLELTIRQKRV